MNLQQLLDDLGLDYRLVGEHHHATHNRIQVDCPWCSPNSARFLLGIHIHKGFANCWQCGPHSIKEVLYKLTGSYAFLPNLHFDFSQLPPPDKKVGTLKMPEGIGPLLPVHLTYLQSRGFVPDQLVQLWHIQGIGLHPRLAWRIFIPVYYQGEVVSWLTRSIGKREPRYLNASPEDEKFPLKSLLFGEDYVGNSLIVCEGPLDAMKIGPGAIATMGLGYTSEQLAKISSYPKRVICFDSEVTAQIRARELCRELALFPGETINIQLESGKDPAEASEQELQEIRKNFLDL